MLNKVLATADAEFEQHVARLQRYIRQPSVSAENRGVFEMADMLAADIGVLGGVGRAVPGVDFPIVYGRFDVGAERTVLIHSMYDTTPADEPGWVVDPFAAVRRDFEDFGACIVGRGAEDTKGPVATVCNMIDTFRLAGVPLPVNLILLFEASELCSASLPPFVHAHVDELRDADIAYWPWHTQRPDGDAVVWLGVKGQIQFKLRVRAGEWGGPSKEIHGLNSTWIGNPAHYLVQALATLRTADDLDVAIEGYYGDGDPITEDDERLIKILAQRLDPRVVLKDLFAQRFKQPSFEEALKAHCFQSEFNISGLRAGHVIEGGHKVNISPEAVASLELRPLLGMTVEQAIGALRRHLDAHGFPAVEIEVGSGYLGSRLPVRHWAVQELLGAYADCGFDPEIWPRAAPAIAADLFTTTLGIPWIATCPGHAGRKHGANEYLQLSTFRQAVPFMCRLMWRLAHSNAFRKPARPG
jgi:acetylornithine deacetylase/succinyl-diaminopimelate desuccinylase-like protein